MLLVVGAVSWPQTLVCNGVMKWVGTRLALLQSVDIFRETGNRFLEGERLRLDRTCQNRIDKGFLETSTVSKK